MLGLHLGAFAGGAAFLLAVAAWRRQEADGPAGIAYRAGLWGLTVLGGSLLLRLAGVV
ncbi:MAG: hypothetical protein ACPHID_07860 [Thermoplasmatota archaeon]